jgi:hypothetical protein
MRIEWYTVVISAYLTDNLTLITRVSVVTQPRAW